jgi:hypothetical protein
MSKGKDERLLHPSIVHQHAWHHVMHHQFGLHNGLRLVQLISQRLT